ncbi:MAG: gamma-glutamyl-gamma-aminobutyrate hydrolase family protein [Firmicutes bacterium]|nr:gamma-glutamyl-gamma-aminobutyrate hydrolase family protein [Bacillota bacterium]
MKSIGIIPLYDDDKESYWMLPGYMKMLEERGAAPLMLPLSSDKRVLDWFLNICGGLLFTGGHDVSPELYHAERSANCGMCCPARDEEEAYILKECVKRDKPVLGICRGIQFMNACFGGTLYQDLPSEYDSAVEHHMTPPYDRTAHYVDIKRGMLRGIIGADRIGVNSYHHQAVRGLSPRFREAARSEDGLIEAIYMPDKKFILGVQWHPEFSYKTDENSRKIITAFVNAVSDSN